MSFGIRPRWRENPWCKHCGERGSWDEPDQGAGRCQVCGRAYRAYRDTDPFHYKTYDEVRYSKGETGHPNPKRWVRRWKHWWAFTRAGTEHFPDDMASARREPQDRLEAFCGAWG